MKTRNLLAAALVVTAFASCEKDKDDQPKNDVKVFEPVVAFNTNPGSNYVEVGNQYNVQKGCYLDLIGGRARNLDSAKRHPYSIDLIFLAPNDGQNAYYLMTPAYSRSGAGANAMWGSNSTENPVKSWSGVNESEIAATDLTATDFYNVSTNSQLSAAVQGADDFSGNYVSAGGVKLTGQVFAVKLNMDNRALQALILIVDHLGTSGTTGYLKIIVKVTGIDTNNDGKPDNNGYRSRL
ncbi:hypothetical protein [Longitalea luteola]|uniref:hypothetical protein n=1 Tax=Longitalea luteola TaxID=2812563 RepID=UPI001A958091|nr:hypothetical protein [Longitalea luteola]